MINCCIEKKRLREGLSTKATMNADKNMIDQNKEKDEVIAWLNKNIRSIFKSISYVLLLVEM